MAGPDPADAYSRAHALGALQPFPAGPRLGVPMPGQRVFFGDAVSAAGYEAALDRFARLGATIVTVDIEPFYETARLLYDGPWVAERYIVARSLIASAPEAMHPVTRQIILGGARPTAVDTFAALYKLEDLRRVRDHIFRDIDALALPTMPTAYTVEQVMADPVQLNSRLGTYTNFVNLLEMCGLALPAAMRPDGTPFGVTLLARSGRDSFLASIGRVFHADTGLALGATGTPQPALEPVSPHSTECEVALGVVGAHLSGMPLNGELIAAGARRLETTTTANDYRLLALSSTQPPKPGLLRVAAGSGSAIELEIWAMPVESFGRFVAAVPPPLSIGTIVLADGRTVKGFLVEAQATVGARDISALGGWRAFVAQSKVAAT
jgi:allophanate hydrolase